MNPWRKRCLLLWFLLGFSAKAEGYTYFIEKDTQGVPQAARWPSPFRVTFFVDNDPMLFFGQSFFSIVEKAAKHWSPLPASALSLEFRPWPVDVHASNFQAQFRLQDQRPLIVLEKDGQILKSLGLDPEYVAGIGLPITASNPKGLPEGPFLGPIQNALIVVNTRFASHPLQLESLVAHEMGHTLGLGHSNVLLPAAPAQLPIMFYDVTQKPLAAFSLHPDDRAGLLGLYPTPASEIPYGAIEGKVMRSQGSPVFGAILLAVHESGFPAIGGWSDEAGLFQIAGLPPGRYHLLTRALDGSLGALKMKPESHIGGLYQKATTSFCPEFYNDHSFTSCLGSPSRRDLLSVVSQTTLHGLEIREMASSPSPPPSCRIGSASKVPGVALALPSALPGLGLRHAPCPRPEPPAAERPPPEKEAPQEALSLDASSPPERPSETLILGGCCSTSGFPSDPSWLLWLVGAFFLRSLRRWRVRFFGGLGLLGVTPFFAALLFLSSGLGLAAALFLPSSVEALTLRRPTFQALVEKADIIARVRVLRQIPRLDARPLPMLESVFRVLAIYKGSPPPHLSILLPLPQAQGRHLFLALPRFQSGQEAFVFLRRDERSSRPYLVALFFGVFDILPSPHGERVVSRGQLLPPLPLNDFLALVRRLSSESSRFTKAIATELPPTKAAGTFAFMKPPVPRPKAAGTSALMKPPVPRTKERRASDRDRRRCEKSLRRCEGPKARKGANGG